MSLSQTSCDATLESEITSTIHRCDVFRSKHRDCLNTRDERKTCDISAVPWNFLMRFCRSLSPRRPLHFPCIMCDDGGTGGRLPNPNAINRAPIGRRTAEISSCRVFREMAKKGENWSVNPCNIFILQATLSVAPAPTIGVKAQLNCSLKRVPSERPKRRFLAIWGLRKKVPRRGWRSRSAARYFSRRDLSDEKNASCYDIG